MRASLFPLALTLACGGSTPLASFSAVGTSDDACSKLMDYCVRGSCAVKNDGPIPGQAVVDLQLVDAGGTVLFTETKRVELGAGDTSTVSHDFKEAELGKKVELRCVVR